MNAPLEFIILPASVDARRGEEEKGFFTRNKSFDF